MAEQEDTCKAITPTDEGGAHYLTTEDEHVQAYVLRESLADHPALYQISDLARKMANGSPSSVQVETMRCAVDEMVRAGLLRKVGEGDDYIVVPTVAALHFHALLGHFA